MTTSQPVGAQNFLLGGCAAGVHLRAPPEHARRLAHGTCSLHRCRVDGLLLIEVETVGEQHAVLSELDASAAGSSATWRMATTERSSPWWHASAHRWAAALYGSAAGCLLTHSERPSGGPPCRSDGPGSSGRLMRGRRARPSAAAEGRGSAPRRGCGSKRGSGWRGVACGVRSSKGECGHCSCDGVSLSWGEMSDSVGLARSPEVA